MNLDFIKIFSTYVKLIAKQKVGGKIQKNMILLKLLIKDQKKNKKTSKNYKSLNLAKLKN